jgi:hypothetical protein
MKISDLIRELLIIEIKYGEMECKIVFHDYHNDTSYEPIKEVKVENEYDETFVTFHL